MPEAQQKSHFWIRFKDEQAARLFRMGVDERGPSPLLERHHYTIISREMSPEDRSNKTVDITVSNGGGPVELSVIRQFAGQFQGFANEMGSFDPKQRN